MDERCWSVGELAAAAGLTVRALHHFDRIGLLRPARRSAAGHRVYLAEDVRRLYRVLALRQLRMPLEQIARFLDGDIDDLASAVHAQLAYVEKNVEAQQRVHAHLSALLRAAEQSPEPSVDQLIETMEALMEASYFTPAQLDEAKRRHRDTTFAEKFAQWQHQATEIVGDLKAHVDRATDPSDPVVQELARRWTDVLRELSGGSAAMLSAIYAKIDGKGPEAATRGVLSAEVWNYLKRVFAVGYGAVG
jgi:DNA-binding transcriptional MerR regulator